MNAKKPADALTVEVRDPSLATVYFRGALPADHSTTDFKWHAVKSTPKAELKEGASYLLIFHSRGTQNTACWAVNAICRDIYPHGVHAHEDFFVEIQFANCRTLRVGPEGENTEDKTPISSGNEGGTPHVYGEQRLADGKKLPDGVLALPAKPQGPGPAKSSCQLKGSCLRTWCAAVYTISEFPSNDASRSFASLIARLNRRETGTKSSTTISPAPANMRK